jgi:hypothetical protein
MFLDKDSMEGLDDIFADFPDLKSFEKGFGVEGRLLILLQDPTLLHEE